MEKIKNPYNPTKKRDLERCLYKKTRSQFKDVPYYCYGATDQNTLLKGTKEKYYSIKQEYQGFDAYEVVVSVDGSTDNKRTTTLVDIYADVDYYFNIIQLVNENDREIGVRLAFSGSCERDMLKVLGRKISECVEELDEHDARVKKARTTNRETK